MTYQDKLKDPRWQKKRLEILERDEKCCQICSIKDRTLHVHHLFYNYDVDPWEYDDKYLMTLCDKHHELIHEFNIPYQFLVIWRDNRESFAPILLDDSNAVSKIFNPEKLEKLFNDYIAGIIQELKEGKDASA